VTTPFGPADLCRVLDVAFTAEQLAAITAPAAPSVVVAGAGSGKTTVMSARVVWLVATGQVMPDAVLGLTFTNKAAAELSARVRRALGRLEADGSDPDAADPTVLTYHAYAARLLREHGIRLGLEPGALLLADASRYQVAERVVRRAAGPFHALRGSVSDLAGRVVALDAELSEHLVDPAEVVATDTATVAAIDVVEQEQGRLTADPARARDTARARIELVGLVAAYRAEKLRRDRADFGDQMAGAARLAEEVPEVGYAERARFGAVLLDEYQDTSITQKRLLLGLFGGGHPVTAVGDPFQAVYGWRGASVRNIGSFSKEFTTDGRPAAAFTLARNNRSGENILDLANRVADPLRDLHPEVPVLVPRPEAVGLGEVVTGLYRTRDDEVAAVVADIVAQVSSGVSPRDVAVLARAGRTFAAYHEALTAADVPVEVVGLGGLLSLPEVVDLVATLEVLENPTANAALVRLLVGPRWRVGPRDLALLGRRARQLVAVGPAGAAGEGSTDPLDAALLDAVAGVDPTEVVSLADALRDPGPLPYAPEARERFAELSDELARLRRHRAEPLLDLVHLVLGETGLDVEVSATPHALHARRRQTLDSFLDHVAGFADLDGQATVGSFLAYLRAADEYQGGLDSTAPSGADSVKLLTVHKAKGLEWDVVYLPDLTEGSFPSDTSRALWTRQPQVLPYELRGDAPDFPTVSTWKGNQGLKQLVAQMKDHDAAEERRLGYVAFTRARHRLVATGHWWGPTQKTRRGPSEFLLTAHAFCDEGRGVVARWEPEPEEPSNPALDDPRRHVWPAPPDASAEQARRDGAALVRAATADGLTAPDDSLDPAWSTEVACWDADLEVLLAEAREHLLVDRVVTLPASMSASQLVRLSSDPDGLARDLARPVPRPPAPAARRGTRFHAWVEARFGQAALLDLDDLAGAADPELLDADLELLQKAFLAGPYADLPPYAVEAPFQLVLGAHTVRGRIDAVYDLGDGRFEVVDWKTGRSAADALQLAVYRLAWAELSGVDVDQVAAAFYYVTSGRVDRPEGLPARAELTALLSA
jgi:ATP-dependent DNA helicase UvrD/PcrA